jgi:hypothetical protein
VAVKAFLENEIVNKWCGENTDHLLNFLARGFDIPSATVLERLI